jgi:hypothetical protein
MRKVFFIISCISLLFFACNDEEYLERNPHNLTDKAFYTSVSGAIQGVNATYDILQLGEDVERIEFTGTVCSGDAMAGGEPGGNDQGPLQSMMKFLTFPSNNYVTAYWRSMYRGVYRANLVIKYLTGPEEELEVGFDPVLRERLLGEVYFLRALFHFKLQIAYGGYPQLQSAFNNQLLGVPYVDHILPPEEWQQGRPPLDSTWMKIEKDFRRAMDRLPLRSEYEATDMGRATKGAAQAMLAKTYLYQEKWQQAYDNAKAVIESGEYYLMGDDEHQGPFTVTRRGPAGEISVDMVGFKYLFQPEANNCPEAIFEVQHYSEGTLLYPQGQEGNLIPRYYGPRSIKHVVQKNFPDRTDGPANVSISTSGGEYFWGFILPTDYFVNTAYADVNCVVDGEIVDPRYKLTVVENNDPMPAVPIDIEHGFTYQTASGEVTWDSVATFTFGDSLPYSGFFNWPTPGRCTWKYFTDPIYSTRAATLGDYPQNTKYLRFADLLLMGAEAAVHIGAQADADAWVNWVRERARNSGDTDYPQDISGVTLEQIYAERRVELAFEGHQFWDIVRTGRAQQVLKEDAMEYPTMENPERDVATGTQQWGNNFQIGKHEIWPIPEQEIDNSQGAITQNPGYE